MAFKNIDGAEYSALKIQIYAIVGKKITYTHIDGEGIGTNTRTTTYTIPNFSGFAGAIDPVPFESISYNTTDKEWVASYPYGTQTIEGYRSGGNSISCSFTFKGNDNFRELASFSYDSDGKDYSFRTRLHADTPKSTTTISYVDENAYTFYLNGTKYTDNGQYPDGCTISRCSCYNITNNITQYSETETLSYKCRNTTIGTGACKVRIYYDGWALPDISVNQSVGSSFFKAKGNGTTLQFETNVKGYVNYWGGNDNTTTQYQYCIETANLNNADTLRFTCPELAEETPNYWTGHLSPYFKYLGSASKRLLLGGYANWTTDTYSSECHTSESNHIHTYTLSDSKSLPTTIGNITCINPENINDYTQTSSSDGSGKVQGETGFNSETQVEVRNGIFKLIPNLNCESKKLLNFNSPTLASSDGWQLVNCHLNDDNEIIVDGANPYVYQDFYRPKYSQEQDDNNLLEETEYRQRHFTHYRYMQCNFVYRDITETVEEGEEYNWYYYKPDISLICKSYGEVSGHTWTATFSDTSQNYDLLMCNANADSSVDEYGSVAQPEWLELRDESGGIYEGVTYYAEKPMTAFGYLPNIVGQIKIPISTNSNYRIKLGSLTSNYVANIQYKEKVADINFNNDFTEEDFTIDYSQGREDVNIKIEDGKIYFDNESVTNISYTITTAQETLQVLDSWDYNTNYNINYAIINVNFTYDNVSYVNTYRINFLTSRNIINFKHFEDTENNQDGIEFKYYTIPNDDIAEYFYRDGVLYVKARYDFGMSIDCGSEFQEPLEFGQYNPKAEGSETSPTQVYHNRFIEICINGARSYEIPEVIRKVGNTIETWTVIGINDLKTDSSNKGNRFLFQRDDLGEISFNLNTYTADEDGNYHIDCLTKGNGGWVNWLRRTYTIATDGNGNQYYKPNVYIRPRTDYISSSNLARYIKNNGQTFMCVADYGASVQGLNMQDNKTGSITDTSPYANSGNITFNGNTYFDEKHGTATTVNLNSKTRSISKVYDGGKFHFSIIKILGYIWRNANGLILRNASGVILQGKKHQ